MPTLTVKAYRYVFPVKATVMVVDNAFWAMGDVNRDGIIDSADLDRLKAAYGSYPGHPRWDPECDLNGDGLVEAGDIFIAARNFGKTAPEYTTPFTVEVAVGKCILYARYKTMTRKAELEMAEENTKKVTFWFGTIYSKHFVR